MARKVIIVTCPACGETVRGSGDVDDGPGLLAAKALILAQHKCGGNQTLSQ